MQAGRCFQQNRFVDVLVTLVLSVVIGASGCNRQQEREKPTVAPPDGTTAPHAFSVAAIVPQDCGDKGWSQAGCEGMQHIEKDLDAKIVIVTKVTPEAAQARLVELADEGHDFIIAHGMEYIPAAEKAAFERPRTAFAVMGQYPGNNRNLGGVNLREYELTYLAAAAATLASKSKTVAYIVGDFYGDFAPQEEHLLKGARAVDPQARVLLKKLGSWTDEAKARAAAREALNAGADVLIVNADVAGFAAWQEAKRVGAKVIGWVADQESLDPDTVLTSGIQDYNVLFVESARIHKRGQWEGKQYSYGFAENAQSLAPFRGALPAEKLAIIEKLRADVMAEKLEENR